jgi:DNA repair protein RecO (recombination protein O)
MSAQQRISLEPAYVLHRYPYRDSSLLLEVFSKAHGRVGLVARAARSAKSAWRGQLQVFELLSLSWVSRGDLGTLTGAELSASAGRKNTSLPLSAWYMNELIMRLLTRNDPHPGLFDAYQHALDYLVLAEEPALRQFEKQLLDELGYGLLLDHDADTGEPLVMETLYEYQLEKGPVKCHTRDSSGLYLHGASLLALHEGSPGNETACREVKTLMRTVLSYYLGEKPLKSRAVLQQLARLQAKQPAGKSMAESSGQVQA